MSKEQPIDAETIVLTDWIAGLDVDAVDITRIADWKRTKVEEMVMKLPS
ncbi:MAG: hypothetical protein QGI57_02830 [Dehalococcoidales bacterium]|jgi:hypothetical protein|nr:hypothetical protein [Dehalococcoidales bacterium]